MSAAPAVAATTHFVDFTGLNGQTIDARANLELDGNLLSVSLYGTGFTPNESHLAHIHGFPSAPVTDSRSPVPANGFDPFSDENGTAGFDNDGAMGDPNSAFVNDGDGFTELFEAFSFYGNILLPFDDGSGGLMADSAGRIAFDMVYDLTMPDGSNPFDMRDVIVGNGYKLSDREIVIHGIETTASRLDLLGTGTGGGVDPSVQMSEAYYNIAIPAAVGEISPVPLPAGGWFMLAGLGGLAALRRKKKA